MKAREHIAAEDDPRLTAYALGELDPAENAEVEARLREDAEARRVVEEVRAAAALLERELAGEEGVGLTQEQRTAVESAAAPRRTYARRTRRVRILSGLAAAGITALAVGAGTWVSMRLMQGAEYAVAEKEITASLDRAPEELFEDPQADSRSSYERQLRGLGYTSEEVSANPPQGEADGIDAEEPLEEPILQDAEEHNTEAYDRIVENPFQLVRDEPLSTFSIDVDTASYANVRRYLSNGELPPPDAVRIEELVNYFPYSYAGPTGEHPFAVHVETAGAPWAPRHRLVRIGLQGREIGAEGRKASNLVFLIDVSGSMNNPKKLPLLKDAMKLLVRQLDERDSVAIAVYAGAAGLVLPPTSAGDAWAILDALERLSAGGSTAGGAGIQLAYEVAAEHFLEGGVNRVILATDGDFNVGVSDDGSLVRLIEEKRKTGVFLSVLGFGTGNYKDAKLEKLADAGNGNYAYIDGPMEARKVLVEQLGATLETIAKDVKIQVEFNPLGVEAYRLIGYENRLLAARDFNDDTKDAGEIGAGHSVTALYEVVPAGRGIEVPGVDPLRYQTAPQPSGAAASGELLTLKLRYKQPDGDTSRLIEAPVTDTGGEFATAGEDLRFAAAVAAFGMQLRDSAYAGDVELDDVLRWARESLGDDEGGYREQFLGLVRRALAIER